MKDNSRTLEDNFFSKTDPSVFTSVESVLLERSIETSCVILGLELKSHLLPQFAMCLMSNRRSKVDINQV